MSEAETLAFVYEQANAIADPCAVAMGVPIGLHDMGLIKDVRLDRGEGGIGVCLGMRLTSPDCLYFLYFERELRDRLIGQGEITTVTFEWHSPFEWSPELMNPTSRQALEHLRQHKRNKGPETPAHEGGVCLV